MTTDTEVQISNVEKFADIFLSMLKDSLIKIPEYSSLFVDRTRTRNVLIAALSRQLKVAKKALNLTQKELAQINNAALRMREKGIELHSASPVNAKHFAQEIGLRGTLELAETLDNFFQEIGDIESVALKDFFQRSLNGHAYVARGLTPQDKDPRWDTTIYGHTQLTYTDALIEFAVAHFIERYVSAKLNELGIEIGKEKDYFLNVMSDVISLDYFGDKEFLETLVRWQADKSNGGLGWFSMEKLLEYNPALGAISVTG